jgi:hypothetical protein
MTLLTVIGVLGSLLGIVGIAVPYFIVANIINIGCDTCTDANYRAAKDGQVNFVTLIIVILSVLIGFLPRILYGRKLRKVRRQQERQAGEEKQVSDSKNSA